MERYATGSSIQSIRRTLYEHEDDDDQYGDTAPEDNVELGPYANVDVSDERHYYGTLLNTSNWSVNDLSVKPGERSFMLWFMTSSYFPLVAGCMGPVGNLMSLCAIICKWRVQRDTNQLVADYPWILKVNGISVMFGLISNISLLLNFRKKLRYTVSQVISLSGWFIAGCILLALVVSARFSYFHEGSPYVPSEGYWFAVITVVLYFLCFAILMVNELGFLLKKYPPVFNIDGVQKSLMTQSIMLCVWLLWGAAVFSKLLHISFAEAVYFGVVTILTIGLGDFVPKTGVGMFVVLLWTTFGLISFGLVISTIRELVLFSGSSTLYWHRVEADRRRQFKNIDNNLSPAESFNVMRDVTKRQSLIEKCSSLFVIVNTWLLFWLIGALVFHYVEGWDYGVACYFCFLCLVTIGYGSPSPETHGGRAFFVIWGLCAVPLMTILVSNLGDILFASLQDANNMHVIDTCVDYVSRSRFAKWPPFHWFTRLMRKSVSFDTSTAASANMGSHRLDTLGEAQELLSELKKSVMMLKQNPGKKYSFEEWENMMRLVGRRETAKSRLFWISEESPFRFPFDEPQYFTFYYIHTLEQKLEALSKQPNN